MKLTKILTFLAAVIMLAGCGEGDTFRILGTVDGLGTQNLRLIYYTDHAVKVATTTAIDGKFNYEGRAQQPVIVEVFTNNSRVLLGRLVVKNGETVTAQWSTSSPAEVKLSGNKTSEQLAAFISDNKEAIESRDAADVNAAVERYVNAHPSEFLSTMLILSYYDTTGNEARADSLLMSVDLKARPSAFVEGYSAMLERHNSSVVSATVVPMSLYSSRGSMTTVTPQRSHNTLLCFSTADDGRRDSILPVLKRLAKRPDSILQVVEISLDPDTATWLAAVRLDSVAYRQVWAPGAVSATAVSSLSVPRAPFFILTDSTGRQLYRGSSVSEVTGVIDTEK